MPELSAFQIGVLLLLLAVAMGVFTIAKVIEDGLKRLIEQNDAHQSRQRDKLERLNEKLDALWTPVKAISNYLWDMRPGTDAGMRDILQALGEKGK